MAVNQSSKNINVNVASSARHQRKLNRRKRANLLLAITSIIFFISWTPLNILNVIILHIKPLMVSVDRQTIQGWTHCAVNVRQRRTSWSCLGHATLLPCPQLVPIPFFTVSSTKTLERYIFFIVERIEALCFIIHPLTLQTYIRTEIPPVRVALRQMSSLYTITVTRRRMSHLPTRR